MAHSGPVLELGSKTVGAASTHRGDAVIRRQADEATAAWRGNVYTSDPPNETPPAAVLA